MNWESCSLLIRDVRSSVVGLRSSYIAQSGPNPPFDPQFREFITHLDSASVLLNENNIPDVYKRISDASELFNTLDEKVFTDYFQKYIRHLESTVLQLLPKLTPAGTFSDAQKTLLAKRISHLKPLNQQSIDKVKYFNVSAVVMSILKQFNRVSQIPVSLVKDLLFQANVASNYLKLRASLNDLKAFCPIVLKAAKTKDGIQVFSLPPAQGGKKAGPTEEKKKEVILEGFVQSSDLQKVINENDENKQRIVTLEAQVEDLTQRYFNASAEKEKVQEEFKQFQKKEVGGHNALKAQYNEAVFTSQKLQSQLIEANSKIKELSTNNDILKKMNDELEKYNNTFSKSSQDQAETMKAANAKIAALENELSKIKISAQTETDLKALQKQLHEQEKMLKSQSDELTQRERRLSVELSESMMNSSSALLVDQQGSEQKPTANQTKQIQLLEKKYQEAAQRVLMLEREKGDSAVNSEHSALMKQVESQNKKISDQSKMQAKLNESISNLKKRIVILVKENASAVERYKHNFGMIENALSELESKNYNSAAKILRKIPQASSDD